MWTDWALSSGAAIICTCPVNRASGSSACSLPSGRCWTSRRSVQSPVGGWLRDKTQRKGQVCVPPRHPPFLSPTPSPPWSSSFLPYVFCQNRTWRRTLLKHTHCLWDITSGLSDSHLHSDPVFTQQTRQRASWQSSGFWENVTLSQMV